MGVISPVGLAVDEFWSALLAGRSGVGPITRFDASSYPVRIGAEVRGFAATDYMDRKEARHMDRFSQYAVAAAAQAVAQAGLDLDRVDRTRVGVVLGTGIGGIETEVAQQEVMFQRGRGHVSPFFIPMMIANMAAGQIAIHFGFGGPNNTVVTACASGNNAIGEAFRVLQRGDADAMLAGGSEAPFVPLCLDGFCAMRALSTRNDDPEAACRPFDLDRDGFVIGEGAGVVVLETLEHALGRGVPILAEVIGYGYSADAYHVTAPPPDGNGGARAMAAALSDAGLAAEDVDYINAHGTGTPQNDRTETLAIRRVFGDHAGRTAISSTKSMTAHLLGAAGAVEFVACVQSLRTGWIAPTINYARPDPECDLDYTPNEAVLRHPRVAMSNAFGFGGQNATVVVKSWNHENSTGRPGGSGVATTDRH